MKNSKVNSFIPATGKETARAEAGEKTAETVIQKIFANCPCREAKTKRNAELV